MFGNNGNAMDGVGGVLIVLAAAGGCGGPATITGKVTYQGRPVVYGSVIFLSADKTARSAVIQPDGSYTVENVPPGAVKIGVISRDPANSRAARRRRQSSPPGNPPDGAGGGRMVPAAARNLKTPKRPGLASRLAGGHVHHDIELK